MSLPLMVLRCCENFALPLAEICKITMAAGKFQRQARALDPFVRRMTPCAKAETKP
jgi:hypothetical protein